MTIQMSLHQPTDASFYSITSLFVNKCRCHRNYLEENKHSHFTNNKYLAIKLLRTMSGSDYSCEFFFRTKISICQWINGCIFDLIWSDSMKRWIWNLFDSNATKICSRMWQWEFLLTLFIVNLSLFKKLHCYHWLLASGYTNIR